MATVPFHTHNNILPTATSEDINAGLSDELVVTPLGLKPVLLDLGGDMAKAVYDPNGVVGDAFSQDNMADGSANKNFTVADQAKLSGIEASADVTDAANIAVAVNGVSAKATPADADVFGFLDSAALFVLKKFTWANAKAALKTYFDTIYAAVAHTHAWSDLTAKPQNLVDIAALADPGADRILFWDDSANAIVWLAPGTNMSISGTNLNSSGGGGGGGGDMFIATYDPTGKNSDAFDMDNMSESATKKILSSTERTKLAGIEASADVTDGGNVGAAINAATGKTTPADADVIAILDSAASNVLKKLTWANAKTTLKTYFDSLYVAADDELTALASLTSAADRLPYFTGAGTAATTTMTAFARSVLDDADAATARATLDAEKLGEQVGINTQTGSTYTLALTDKGKVVEMNNASSNTLTVPPNSSVALPVNSRIDLSQIGVGQTTIAAGSGVTIRSSGGKLKIAGQYSGATLYKRATDEWVLVGSLAS